MANQVVNRQINIFIQSGEAQKALDVLIKKEEQLKEQLKLATDPDALQKLKDQLAALSSPLDVARTAAQQAKLEINDLISKEKTLLNELKTSTDAGRNSQIRTELEKLPILMEAARKKVAETKSDVNSLIAKERELKAAIASAMDPKVAEGLRQELAKLQEPIDRAKKKLSGELEPSLRDTEKAARNVRNEFSKMSAGDDGFEKMLQLHKQSTQELENQRTKMGFLQRAMRSFWEEAKTVSVGVIVGNTVQTAIQTVFSYITGMVTGSAKIADELSSIEKSTGLTTAQVRTLNKELATIDTRTAQSQLREIATGLGQINQAATKENVQAIDQIVVALGDEFGGGAKEITTTLSVLRNNLQDIKTGNYGADVTHIGNALNELGAKGLATAPVVTDIANRIAGVASTFRVSSGSILGTAATFQELGIEVERGSTAYIKILQKMAAEPQKFAQVAGQSVEQFTKLVNTDMTAAFVAVATGAQKAGSSNVAFGKILKDLDADGSGAGEVLSKLGKNSDLLKEKIELATGALKENNSITEEFSKVNNNAAGEYEKFIKNVQSFFASNTIQEAIAAIIRTLNSFVNVLRAIPEFIDKNHFALLTLVAGIVLLNRQYVIAAGLTIRDTTLKVANAVATRATALAQNILGASAVVLGNIMQVVTGRMTLAAAATNIWRAALSLGAGPLGIILVAAGALAIVIGNLVTRTRELTNLQKIQADVAQRVAESTHDQLNTLDTLVKVVSDSAVAEDTRAKALQKIIDLNPELLKGLTLENIKTKEGTDIINNYVKALKDKATMQAKADIVQDAEKTRLQSLAALRAVPAYKDISDADAEVLLRSASQSGSRTGVKKQTIGSLDGDAIDKTVMALDAIKSFQKEVDAFNAKKVIDQINGKGGIGGAAEGASGIIEKLKAKLEDLQNRRTKSTSENEITSLTKQIKDTEDEIARLEGRTTTAGKAAKKTAKDWKELEDELRGIAIQLGGDSGREIDKQIAELDRKYAKLRERATGNNKLLLEVERLYQAERTDLERAWTKKEMDRLDKLDVELLKRENERKERLLKMATATLTDSMVRLGNTLNKDTIARDELDVLRSRGKARLAAELQLLKDQERQELANTDLTEKQKELIREKYRLQRGEKEKNALLEDIQNVIAFAKGALDIYSIFADAKTARENADLARDQKINEKKKKNLENQLKAGVLSQLDYDRKVQQIEKEQEKRDKENKIKQFRRAQRMQIAQAFINGAMSITSTLAAIPGPLDILSLGTARTIQIALAAATIAAQIATISKQKPEFGRGGMLNGPAHADKSNGLPVVHPYTGQVQAYLEGGEGIGSKKTMNDQRRYDISGTPSQIFSYLNGVNGGVTWQTGAVLRPAWSTQKPVRMNIGTVNRSIETVRTFYASGGLFETSKTASPAPENNDTGLSAEMMDLFRQLIATNASLQQTIASLQANGVNAYMMLSESEKAKARNDARVAAGTMKA